MIGLVWIAWNLEFMLRPPAWYVLLALGMGLCLCLFATLKAEISALLRRLTAEGERVQALERMLGEARSALQSLEAELRAVERQTGMLVPPAPARSGLNLSKRTQVLRMHRAGEDTAGIAVALALPRSEVDLLVKVHRIAIERI